ncbi:MAG: site-specific DNA-methyltransferase [Phycisphaerae bacterium]|nr:site-specific DNA-methyltransferase [Phycisphaerae bacterium]
MTPYYADNSCSIYHGDCLQVMAAFAPDRFSRVITDPPYHLTANKHGGSGFMGKAWDGGDVAFRSMTWAGVLRVCKPGAILLAFGGTRTFHRLACAIEDAGWEIRDCISWLYGSGFPKSLDIGKAIDKAAGAEREVVAAGAPVKRMIPGADQNATGSWIKDNGREFTPTITKPATAAAKMWEGWGTALKPAWEPVIIAMKPLDGTFAENAISQGVAGLNIDAARIQGKKPDTTRGSGGRNGRYAPIKAQGRILDDGKGRFPANVMLDEQAAEILDAQSGELTSGLMRSGNRRTAQDKPGSVCYGTFGGDTTKVDTYADSGGASRFFYTAKASKADRGHGNDHPTVKPLSLMKYLCRLTSTPTGGEILDPFGGSFTTLVAARECGIPCVGIDIDQHHCDIGIERLRQGLLFSPSKETA